MSQWALGLLRITNRMTPFGLSLSKPALALRQAQGERMSWVGNPQSVNSLSTATSMTIPHRL